MTKLFLTLAACERDPTLIGYWEVASMRAGTGADALDEVTKAGFVEFQSNNSAYAMFSYTWSGAWVPDERPDLVHYGTDILVNGDFVESYKEQGETYTVTLTGAVVGRGHPDRAEPRPVRRRRRRGGRRRVRARGVTERASAPR